MLMALLKRLKVVLEFQLMLYNLLNNDRIDGLPLV